MSDSKKSSYSNDEYTVGWICALPAELAAAKGMLDEAHGDPQTQPASADNNTYVLGSMGKFKVVLAALPLHQLGSASAAATTREMLFTFPKIRVGLLVGIGAGIPDYENDQDIRLGDVVIGSHPENGGVVVYDFGKQLADGSFHSISALNRPPRSLLSALTSLKAHHQMEDNKITQYVAEMLDKYPIMRKKGYSHPDPASDRIFQSDYLHPSSAKSCAKCDPTKEIDREEFERFDESPVIHYGTIASGNMVVKDSSKRDAIRERHKAICLEMEAAGLMNNFPCVVIRGICDYADSHKNDRWQPFAAASAAACAKEFLENVQSNAVDAEPSAKDVISQVHEEVKIIRNDVKMISNDMEMISRLAINDQTQEILDWISPIEIERQQSDVINQRQEGTGLWLLESVEFLQWLSRPKETILCAGIPGSGKTVISSIVAEFLNTKFQADPKIQITQVFCGYQQHHQKSTVDVLMSLIRQFVINNPDLLSSMEEIYEKHAKRRTRLNAAEAEEILVKCAVAYTKAFVVIDALDEYCPSKPNQIDDLVSTLFRLEKKLPLSIFATSRFNSEIQAHFKSSLFKEIRAQDVDLLMYVNKRISQLVRSKISRYPETEKEVRRCLLESSDGMFLLAKLHIDHLTSFPTVGQLEENLANLRQEKNSLGTAYDNAISRIQSQDTALSNMAMKTLSWLTYSRRTLSPEELQHALCIRPDMKSIDQRFLPDIETIDSLCAGLVMFDKYTHLIRLAHQTTYEYLVGHLALRNAEVEITAASITYLSCVVSPQMDDFGNLSLSRVYPLHNYCSTWWVSHASAALRVSNKILNLVLEALEEEKTVIATWLARDEIGRWRGRFESFFFDSKISWVEYQPSKAHLAAYFGLNDVIVRYRTNGQNLEIPDSVGQTPLMYAAENRNLETARILLKSPRVNPNSRAKNGKTALWTALVVNDVNIVKEALLHGGSPNGPQRDDRMALHQAILQDNLEIIRLLVHHGANVNLLSFGETPLMVSCSIGSIVATEFLLENEADPTMSNQYGQTAISVAGEHRLFNKFSSECDKAKYGNYILIVKSLLEKGVSVNYQDTLGNTPLFAASVIGDPEVIETLLRNGAAIEHRNMFGETPLFFAAMCGSSSAVNILLENHAKVDSKNFLGETAFIYASRILRPYSHSSLLDATLALLQKGADPEPLYDPRKQKDFLMFFLQELFSSPSQALTENSPSYVKRAWEVWLQDHPEPQDNELLLCFKTSWLSRAIDFFYREVNSKRQNWMEGKSSIWLEAVESGRIDLIRMLFESVPPGPGDTQRNTSLFQVAAKLGDVRIAELFVRSGLDQSAQTFSHDLMMCAASTNNVGMMSLLFSHFKSDTTRECELLLVAAKRGSYDAAALTLCRIIHSQFRMRRQKKWHFIWGADRQSVVKSQRKGQMSSPTSFQRKFLHRKQPHTRRRKKMNERPLYVAFCKSRLRDFEDYLPRWKKGLDKKVVDKKDQHGRTALFWAVQRNWLVIANLLLRLGADPNTTEAGALEPLQISPRLFSEGLYAFHEQSPLFFAAGFGNIEMIKLLLDHGADADHAAASGERPICWAAGGGHQTVVKALLQKGCDASSQTDPLQSPLLWALRTNLDDLEVKCHRGEDEECPTAYIFKQDKTTVGSIAVLLVQYGADPNIVDSKGDDVLFIATALESAALVEALLKSGRDPNPRNIFGRTPFMNATISGMDRIVTLLRENPRIDLEAIDDLGRTVSMEAARMKMTQAVKSPTGEQLDNKGPGSIYYLDEIHAERDHDLNEDSSMISEDNCDLCWLRLDQAFDSVFDDQCVCHVHGFVVCDDCQRLGAVCPENHDKDSEVWDSCSSMTDLSY